MRLAALAAATFLIASPAMAEGQFNPSAVTCGELFDMAVADHNKTISFEGKIEMGMTVQYARGYFEAWFEKGNPDESATLSSEEIMGYTFDLVTLCKDKPADTTIRAAMREVASNNKI